MAGDDRPPPETRLTRSKRRWAEEGRFLTGAAAEAGPPRLPPGQHLARDWPVLDLGEQPALSRDRWRLLLTGAIDRPAVWDWPTFERQPRSSRTSDIHCVTSWSRYDNRWDGVTTRDLLDFVEPRDEAVAVLLHGYDGYTTNLALDDFAAADALLADSWSDAPLSREHGGPVRLVVPHLYFWKSAKWLKQIDFLTEEQSGFWEDNGYHMRGDPWREERYSAD